MRAEKKYLNDRLEKNICMRTERKYPNEAQRKNI
jgi:hypothetical protein